MKTNLLAKVAVLATCLLVQAEVQCSPFRRLTTLAPRLTRAFNLGQKRTAAAYRPTKSNVARWKGGAIVGGLGTVGFGFANCNQLSESTQSDQKSVEMCLNEYSSFVDNFIQVFFVGRPAPWTRGDGRRPEALRKRLYDLKSEVEKLLEEKKDAQGFVADADMKHIFKETLHAARITPLHHKDDSGDINLRHDYVTYEELSSDGIHYNEIIKGRVQNGLSEKPCEVRSIKTYDGHTILQDPDSYARSFDYYLKHQVLPRIKKGLEDKKDADGVVHTRDAWRVLSDALRESANSCEPTPQNEWYTPKR